MSEKVLPERFYTKTVYGLRLPEFNETIRKAQQSDVFLKRHEKPWLKYQDDYHIDFSETYKKWMADSVSGLNQFSHFYPSNGSSEAIKDTLSYLSDKYTHLYFYAFEGEYEGYEAYIKCIRRTAVNYISRKDWECNSDLTYPNNPDVQRVFLLSQPSSIDGDVWRDFNGFVRYLKERGWIVCVDLAYTPLAYPQPFRYTGSSVVNVKNLNADLSDVDFVFISLSKSFGVYYNRIGGVYSKCEIPSLYGNQWFKNIDSLYIGKSLMDNYSVTHVWSLMNQYASRSLKYFKENDIKLSNCAIIAQSKDTENYKDFVRKGSDVARLCISPMIQEYLERTALK
jgi:hypothetical protein